MSANDTRKCLCMKKKKKKNTQGGKNYAYIVGLEYIEKNPYE